MFSFDNIRKRSKGQLVFFIVVAAASSVAVRVLPAYGECRPEWRVSVQPCGDRGGRTRTLDLRFWRPPLYQLSYTPRRGGVYQRPTQEPSGVITVCGCLS